MTHRRKQPNNIAKQWWDFWKISWMHDKPCNFLTKQICTWYLFTNHNIICNLSVTVPEHSEAVPDTGSLDMAFMAVLYRPVKHIDFRQKGISLVLLFTAVAPSRPRLNSKHFHIPWSFKSREVNLNSTTVDCFRYDYIICEGVLYIMVIYVCIAIIYTIYTNGVLYRKLMFVFFRLRQSTCSPYRSSTEQNSNTPLVS